MWHLYMGSVTVPPGGHDSSGGCMSGAWCQGGWSCEAASLVQTAACLPGPREALPSRARVEGEAGRGAGAPSVPLLTRTPVTSAWPHHCDLR